MTSSSPVSTIDGFKKELKQVLTSLLALLECEDPTSEHEQEELIGALPQQKGTWSGENEADEKFEALCVDQNWDGLVAHLRKTQMPLDHGHIMCIIESTSGTGEDCSYILGCAVEATCLNYDDFHTSLVPLAIAMPDWARNFFIPEMKTLLTPEDISRIIEGLWPDTQQLAWFAQNGFLDCVDQKNLFHKSIVNKDLEAFLPLINNQAFDISEGMLVKELMTARKHCTEIYDAMVTRLYFLAKIRKENDDECCDC